MIPRSSENLLMRKTRYLTQALILSGTLNIGLITTFIYFVLQERHESLAIELKPHKKEQAPSSHLTNAQILKAYSLLPYQELLLRLENNELLEDGLYKRDLALSCLIAFHHFHLDKALPGALLQKRNMHFTNTEGEEKIELPVYPGLLDDEFQAILRYAKTEKWPLTPQGLFYEIQRSPPPRDPSLVDAFCLSSEYEAARTLFNKTGLPLSCEFLISILCEGDWKILSHFTQAQRESLDLSADRRRAFLLAYLHQRSQSAARLLLETDLEYILKRSDDALILSVLDLCDEKCTNLEPFAKSLLASLRTDVIWRRAAETLYALAKEQMPEPYDHRLAVERFLPPVQTEASPIVKDQTTPPPKQNDAKASKKLYTIENGDSLWKISRKFHVSIEEIKRVNHLETDKLRPGKQLEIPNTPNTNPRK